MVQDGLLEFQPSSQCYNWQEGEKNKKRVCLPSKGTSKKFHIALPLWLKFSHMVTSNSKSDNQEILSFGWAQCTQLRVEVVITRKKRKMSNGGQ